MLKQEFQKRLKEVLLLDLPHEQSGKVTSHSPPKSAGVLLLFGWSKQDGPEQPYLLFIKRSQHVKSHQGQMAFPGGRFEAVDQNDPVRAALRETHEEVGIPSPMIEPVGTLPEVITTSGYHVVPTAGLLAKNIEEVTPRLDPLEVEEMIWIPFAQLLHPDTYRLETIGFEGLHYHTHVYETRETRIWGATGAILKNLLDRWKLTGS